MSGIDNISGCYGALPLYTQMCNPFGGGTLDSYDIALGSSYYGMPSYNTCDIPSFAFNQLGNGASLYYGAGDPFSYELGGLDSVFGGYGGFGLGGMPYDCFTGMGGAYNNEQFYQNMEENQKFWNQYNINQQKMQRNANSQVNAPMESIQEASDNLRNKIQQNEQGQIMGAYDAFVKSVKDAYGEDNPENVKGRAQTIYKQLNKEKIDEALRKNGHSSWVQGFLSTMTGGFYYRKTAEDNIAEITGQPVGDGDKFMNGFGKTTGALGFGTAAGTIAHFLTKGKAAASGAKGSGKPAIITGIIAAGLSFINSLRN